MRSNGVGLDAFFPVDEVNELAALEAYNKHLFRPNTYLHKWWARRSGTTFRFILKQLCDDPAKRDYYASGGLEGKIILDPMMGGGTTVHEAIRLGASVIGCDIDPIPVLQGKASLTRIPVHEKREIFAQFLSELSKALDPWYETQCPQCSSACETQFTLYGLRKRCRCSESLFVDSLILREEQDGRVTRLDPWKKIPVGDDASAVAHETRPLVFEKTVRRCPDCDELFQDVRDEPFYRRYVPLVAFVHCPVHQLFIQPICDDERQRLLEAELHVRQHVQIPQQAFRVPDGPKSVDLIRRGIASYVDLFTPRQLIYLACCKRLLDSTPEPHRLWLAMVVSTSLEFNSLLCGYKGSDKRRPGAIRHVFSHHAYSFPHTALENNPVFSGETSGTLGLLFHDRIERSAQWAEAPIERKQTSKGWTKVVLRGEVDAGIPSTHVESLLAAESRRFLVMQQDARVLPIPDSSVDHVVTDPPYYDSVQYSDLATFFRVWLHWFLPHAAQWHYEVTDSAVAESNSNGAKYQNALAGIWQECHRVLKKPGGRLVFTFHHWRAEAWAHLTLSLKRANFRLTNDYTVYSENPISVHIRQLNALKHDSILVFQPDGQHHVERRYPALPTVDTSDSFKFCSDCARLLGYCLESELDESQIWRLWKDALGT